MTPRRGVDVTVHLPKYGTTRSLASLLSIPEAQLLQIANSVDSYHRPGKTLRKKNGDPRPTHDAEEPLKTIHERVKNRILKKVSYPYYMLGGIADPINPRSCHAHAKIHSGKKVLITEDIKDFFPKTTKDVVYRVWLRCFNFSPEVADTLTRLTTYQGELPQGWKTSGYLANLVFWEREPQLVSQLTKQGLAYSRFMDDISVSSRHSLENSEKRAIISNVYAMLFGEGYAPKRSKHSILTPSAPMQVTSLNVNGRKPTIPKQERHAVRAGIFKLEQQAHEDKTTADFCKKWKSLSGKVGRITSLHPEEGAKLRQRLSSIKPPAHLLNARRRGPR